MCLPGCMCAFVFVCAVGLFIGLWGSADVSIADRTRLWITSLINLHQRGSVRALARSRGLVHHTRTSLHTLAE